MVDVEQVIVAGSLRALIVRRDFHRDGVHFFTPHDFSQQLGYMSHPTGHRIAPHTHNDVQRDVRATQEVLVLRAGRLRVDFYGEDRVKRDSRVIEAGDIILLTAGGHGFEVLERCEMFEIKPGPYVEGENKTRFVPVDVPAGES